MFNEVQPQKSFIIDIKKSRVLKTKLYVIQLKLILQIIRSVVE